jgi:hypothetical protein
MRASGIHRQHALSRRKKLDEARQVHRSLDENVPYASGDELSLHRL